MFCTINVDFTLPVSCTRLPKSIGVDGKQLDFCSRKCGQDAVDLGGLCFHFLEFLK